MTTFTLEAAFPAKAAAKETPAMLVAAPHARPGFDTERMAYVRSPNQLEYFARHRWIDAPARMLAPLIVQALESTGAFSAVVQAPTVARAKWRLETEIVKLQQDFLGQPSRVEVVLRAQLIDSVTQQAVAARMFATTVAATSDDARGGAKAANDALHQLLPQLAQWCVASLEPAAARQ
jgi:cholesterol transport system auxiliary component